MCFVCYCSLTAVWCINAIVLLQPPPPGVAPTAAQIAAAQGQPVIMSQQKKDKWGLGSDGGATFF